MVEKMTGLKRTHYCGEITVEDVGKEVVVMGWAQRQRDLGQLIFIDLRDRTGIVQLAFDDGTDREIFDKAFEVRSEWVLAAKGVVRLRSSINYELKTGKVEVFVTELKVLARAQTPPFEILENSNVKEENRLAFRYLDLRRPDMQRAIMARHRIVKVARDYFDSQGFLEIETPMLIGSTPEGARDYIVPSRVHKGKFYALPQSPQLYKQLLMLSGFDRYMQVARCFRDEDLRADRQPEFTQIDLEMSFVDREDVMGICEGFVKKVFDEVLGVDVALPISRMSYSEAMERFGSDKPDLRFGMELVNLSGILENCEFRVFSSAVKNGGSVRGFNAKGAAEKLTRKEIDKLTAWVKDYGAMGLAFTRLTPDGETSSYEKFLSAEEIERVRKAFHAETGDVLLIVASEDNQVVFDSLGALRCEVAERLGIVPKDEYKFVWIVDFPLFEFDKEENRFVAKHHPFTSPRDEDVEFLLTQPEKVKAKAYDLVLNGNEVGGGSIRINDPQLQSLMFEALGFTPEEAKRQFGFLLEAFKYGAPPHGGMAFGLDRLVMLMLGKDSIRDVIAFPKVQNASELMTRCPGPVSQKQLDELGIRIVEE